MGEHPPQQKISLLITGGSGFLGKSLLHELLEETVPFSIGTVRVLDLVPPPDQYKDRVKYIRGDIRDPGTVHAACEGMDAVIHLAALVDWGNRPAEEVMDVNVSGTEHVIRACLQQRVGFLVHTSSLDAVYTGKPLRGIDEDQPYPARHQTVYCKSKCEGERLVLRANSDRLSTVVLRPSDIYGEMDPYHIDSLIDMAKGGFYVRLGNGSTKCQHVYAGNMAGAILQALQAMLEGNRALTGKAYFITDGPASNFFEFFDPIISGAGYRQRPAGLWIPRRVAYILAWLAEVWTRAIRPFRKMDNKFTRFAVTYTCTDFTFTSARAERDFGYRVKYSKETAFEKTIAYYRT